MLSEGGSPEASWNGNDYSSDPFSYIRFYFTPIIDDFTVLKIDDSWIKPGGGDCTDCGDSSNAVACEGCEDNLLKKFSNPSIHVQVRGSGTGRKALYRFFVFLFRQLLANYNY